MPDQQPVFAWLSEKVLDLHGNYQALVLYISCLYPECPFRARGQCLIEWPVSCRCPHGTIRVVYGPKEGTRGHQKWVEEQRSNIEELGLAVPLPVPVRQKRIVFLGNWVYVPYDCFFGEYEGFVPRDKWDTQAILNTIRRFWSGGELSDDIFMFLADLYRIDNALWHQIVQAIKVSLVSFEFTSPSPLPAIRITTQDDLVVVTIGDKTYTQPPDMSIDAGILWGVSVIAEEIRKLSDDLLLVSPVTSAAEKVRGVVEGVRIIDWKNLDTQTCYRQFNSFCTNVYNSVSSLREEAQRCSNNARRLRQYIRDLNWCLSRYKQDLKEVGIDITIPRIGEAEIRNTAEFEEWLSEVIANSDSILEVAYECSPIRKRMLDQVVESQEFSLVEKLHDQVVHLAHLASSPTRG